MCKQPNVQNISLLFHATVCQFSVNDTGGRGMEKKKFGKVWHGGMPVACFSIECFYFL